MTRPGLTRRTRLWLSVILPWVGVACAAACGDAGAPVDNGAAGSTSAGSGGTGSGGKSGASGAAGTSTTGGSAGTGIVKEDGGTDALPDGCASISAQATRVPLHLYLLMDRSGSMATKWDAAKAGVASFLNDPASADIDVGFTVFPPENVAPGGECMYAYENPLVPFAKLPGNASAITTALGKIAPNGFGTPIYPALAGALDRGIVTIKTHPTDAYVALLVTDGQPEMPPAKCGNVDALDPATIAGLAETGFKQYKLRTYVVGLPGADPTFTQLVAQKGGGEAILLDNVDVQQKFADALAKIRGEGLGCEFPLPPQADGKMYSYDQVNVRYTEGKGGTGVDLFRSIGCKVGDAWDYDDPINPTKVVLCKDTCAKVKADGLAKVDVVLGCPTNVK